MGALTAISRPDHAEPPRHYIDDLLREMGARTRRLPWNPLRELMMTVDPSLYADLGEELDRRAGAPATPRR